MIKHLISSFIIFLFLFFSFALFSENSQKSPEIELMDHLIFMTKKSLSSQEQIRSDLLDYQKVNEAFLKNPQDTELLFLAIQKATYLYEKIEQIHLQDHFAADFLKELSLFAGLGKNKQEPKP